MDNKNLEQIKSLLEQKGVDPKSQAIIIGLTLIFQGILDTSKQQKAT